MWVYRLFREVFTSLVRINKLYQIFNTWCFMYNIEHKDLIRYIYYMINIYLICNMQYSIWYSAYDALYHLDLPRFWILHKGLLLLGVKDCKSNESLENSRWPCMWLSVYNALCWLQCSIYDVACTFILFNICCSAYGALHMVFCIWCSTIAVLHMVLYIWCSAYGLCLWCSGYGALHIVFCICCSTYGVLHIVLCVWCSAYGALHMVLYIWCSAYGVLHMVLCIWCSTYGVLHMVLYIWCSAYIYIYIDILCTLPCPQWTTEYAE